MIEGYKCLISLPSGYYFAQKYGAVGEGSVASDKRDSEEMEGPLNKPYPLPPFSLFEGNIMLSRWRFYVAIAALLLQGCDLR